jgi:hypothetical protein
MTKILIVFILVYVNIFCGCSSVSKPTYLVNVDSISSSDIIKNKYIIFSGLKDVDLSDLQFQEYSTYIDRALTISGFVKANNIEDANLAIFLVYGIGDPKEHLYSYSIPIFGQTGISSSQTYGTVNTYGSSGTYSGTTTYTPSYGIVGHTTRVGSFITYFRFIILDAVNMDTYRQQQNIVSAWKTTITSTGSSDDLRRVFPVMIAAAKNHIGINTGQKMEVKLMEDDKSVLEIKGLSQKEK